MSVAKEVVDSQLRALPQFQQYFSKKEVAHLPEVLQPNETIRALISGWKDGSTWLVVATTQRIMFLDKGVFGGLKQLDLPLHQIQGVAYRVGMMSGEIAIATAGASWKVDNIQPKHAPQPFAELVNALIQETRMQPAAGLPNPGAASSTTTRGNEDFVARLERLASLRERGVLTDEEFQAQKQRILRGD